MKHTYSINEKIYVPINGQEQYVCIRGNSEENPVILNLHGGPAGPDTVFTYRFAKEICDEYTFVSWEQRGCGRTYYRNKKIDLNNKTAAFEQALQDLDALVTYLCERFSKDKIILMGHSYGTILGVNYVKRHPEKIEKYIGVGQSVSIVGTQTENYYEIMERLEPGDTKAEELTCAFNIFKKNPSIFTLMAFQKLAIPYFTSRMSTKEQIGFIFASPDLSFADIRWLLSRLDYKKFYARNCQLLDYTITCNIYDVGTEFEAPMSFISGEHDKSCNVDLVREYFDKIDAPAKDLVVMKQCGHSPQMEVPEAFAAEVKWVLESKE